MIEYTNLTDLRQQAKKAGITDSAHKSLEQITDFFLEKGEELQSIKSEQKQPKRVTIKTLIFKNSGWCEELQRSYYTGIYTPKNEKEYNALKKYSEGK